MVFRLFLLALALLQAIEGRVQLKHVKHAKHMAVVKHPKHSKSKHVAVKSANKKTSSHGKSPPPPPPVNHGKVSSTPPPPTLAPAPAPPVSAPAPASVSPHAFTVAQSYTGSSFLSDAWQYFNYPDPTHGQVNYVSQAVAQSDHLAYVNSAGHFVMAVDSTSNLASGANRNSIRITSSQTVKQGQLVILDAVHMPTGCGTWPAFWLVGPNWPNGGEVDIVEGVQGSTSNQMTLHTGNGCTLSTPMSASGQVLNTNCYAYAASNIGCGVHEPDTASYGTAFNQANGGVFATLWDATGWSIWFWGRQSVPKDVTAGTPTPSTWGSPSAHWASSTCSSSFFAPQNIVFDITLCGDWAGAVYGQGDSCPGTCSSRIMQGSNFADAYWEVSSVKVYSPPS